jgi:hypothetical protein
MACRLDKINVHYEVVGEGRPILMLHGWPLDHRHLLSEMEPVFERREGWRRIYPQPARDGSHAGQGLDHASRSDARHRAGLHRQRLPLLASALSLLVPGLGQICSGEAERGAAILIAVIVVGNLNVIWLSLFATTSAGPHTFWGYALPRILHDLFAAWGVVFLVWQVVDAYQKAKH